MSENLKKMYLDYLGKNRCLALATASRSGEVNSATVYYAFDDQGRIVFGCHEQTTKARHLAENPRLGATMDDGGRSTMGVQVRGRAKQLRGAEAEQARNMLKERNSSVASFYDTDGVVYFRIEATEQFIINFSWGVDWRKTVPVAA